MPLKSSISLSYFRGTCTIDYTLQERIEIIYFKSNIYIYIYISHIELGELYISNAHKGNGFYESNIYPFEIKIVYFILKI